jgi:two-component system chemotaxis response regulator CheY
MAVSKAHLEETLNSRRAEGLDKDGNPYRILVVDDSLAMRQFVIRFLKSEAYDICGEASNGEEAVKLYNELRPHLVTMDVNMPKMDGITALGKIMAIDPKAKIVMLTSENNKATVFKAVKQGAKNYIVKPPDRKDVLEKVKFALSE